MTTLVFQHHGKAVATQGWTAQSSLIEGCTDIHYVSLSGTSGAIGPGTHRVTLDITFEDLLNRLNKVGPNGILALDLAK